MQLAWHAEVPVHFRATRLATSHPGLRAILILVAVSGGCDPGVFDVLDRSAPDGGSSRPEDGTSADPSQSPDAANTRPPVPAAGAEATPADAGSSVWLPDAAQPDASLDARAPAPDARSEPTDSGAPPATDADSKPSDTAMLDDAARPDAAPPVPVGDSACYLELAARLLCEGFETELEDPPWYPVEQLGEIASIGMPTRRGIGALAARAYDSGGHGFVGRAALPDLKVGTLYLRSYLFVPSGTPLIGVAVHGLSEENEPYAGISIVLRDEAFLVDVHTVAPGVDPVFVSTTPPVTVRRNHWSCLQLEIAISATQGSVKLSVDGEIAAASTAPIATLLAAGYHGVSAGVVYTDSDQPAIELFVDELVADTSPIPCD